LPYSPNIADTGSHYILLRNFLITYILLLYLGSDSTWRLEQVLESRAALLRFNDM